MNQQQLQDLLQGQVIKLVVRETSANAENVLSSESSDELEIQFESGLTMYLYGEALEHGDRQGLEISFNDESR